MSGLVIYLVSCLFFWFKNDILFLISFYHFFCLYYVFRVIFISFLSHPLFVVIHYNELRNTHKQEIWHLFICLLTIGEVRPNFFPHANISALFHLYIMPILFNVWSISLPLLQCQHTCQNFALFNFQFFNFQFQFWYISELYTKYKDIYAKITITINNVHHQPPKFK